MKDPFPTQGRLRGRLDSDLAAREEKRTSARKAMESEQPVVAKTLRVTNAAGNERVLRAIPVTARGVSGAIPKTLPHLQDWDRH